MHPGDRLVCALVRKVAVGDMFQSWPLHVTIVPWFRLDDATDHIVTGLAEALKPVMPFGSFADTETMMGPRKNRPALLIREPSTFHDVERRVRNYFHKKRAWLVDETTKVHRSFRPHVTMQKTDRLQPGDRFQTDALYIIEQKGSVKAVVGEVPLHS